MWVLIADRCSRFLFKLVRCFYRLEEFMDLCSVVPDTKSTIGKTSFHNKQNHIYPNWLFKTGAMKVSEFCSWAVPTFWITASSSKNFESTNNLVSEARSSSEEMRTRNLSRGILNFWQTRQISGVFLRIACVFNHICKSRASFNTIHFIIVWA